MKDVTADQLIVLKRAVTAAADGPYFPDWEFHTLFGLDRASVRAIARGSIDLSRPDVRLAVQNSLASLLGYPHGCNDDVVQDTGVSIEALRMLQDACFGKVRPSTSNARVLRVVVNGPRPPFALVAHQLWGADVDFDSDGNSLTPHDTNWTELTVIRRPAGDERVDIDPVCDTPLTLRVVATTPELATRAAAFLAGSSNGWVEDTA